MLQQAEQAKASVASCSSEPSGPVSFGLPLSLAATLGLPIFQAVSKHHPLVRLQVQEATSGTLLEWVKNGRLSLGLAFDDGSLGSLDALPVLEERLFLVVSPRSPLARRKVVTLAEVEHMDLAMPLPGQGVRPCVERAMVREGLVLSRLVAEVNSLTLLKRAAEEAMAPTILGWPAVAQEVAQGRLAAIEIVRPSVLRVAMLCMLPSSPYQFANGRVREAAADGVRQAILRSRWRGVRPVGQEAPVTDGALAT